jgi:hypothetical protein
MREAGCPRFVGTGTRGLTFRATTMGTFREDEFGLVDVGDEVSGSLTGREGDGELGVADSLIVARITGFTNRF